MSRDQWNGSRVTNAIRFVVARDAGICHLCHHPGANSCDHEIPVTTRPDLEWTPSNWRAAHLHGAGTNGGCQTPGCHCPGNRGRGDAPADYTRRIVAALNAADQRQQQEHDRDW